MGLSDYFKSIPTREADQVKDYLRGKKPDEFNLIDVRQLKEYEREHIPGSQLIPLGELESRIDEIDPEKPTITY
jgi:rhodanese-related sulfurtransferase